MLPNLIAYVGLTHLGLVSAAAALEKGFSVLCFDPDGALVIQLKEKKYPINEPGFAEALEKNKERIVFTSTLADLEQASLIYVAPDIPTDDTGASDLRGIQGLIELIAPHVSPDACLIVLSQVSPGFTRSLQKNLALSSIRPEKIYYQVETLVFGIALQRALYPERFIVGAYNPEVSLDPAFDSFLKAFECPLLVMDYESAEFCKICINAFLAATVSTTNMLEEICQKIGAKWADIIPALRLDKRIGEYAYLAPGLGLSGGNIERDLRTISSLAHKKGTHAHVVEAFIKNSQHRRNWPLQVFYSQVLPAGLDKTTTIGVLGLAYKENTHSTKNSASLKLLSQLKGFRIQVYDPLVKTLPFPAETIVHKPTALDAIKGADVVFVMTPWPEFRELNPEHFAPLMRKKFIIDPYKLFKIERDIAIGHNITYHSLC